MDTCEYEIPLKIFSYALFFQQVSIIILCPILSYLGEADTAQCAGQGRRSGGTSLTLWAGYSHSLQEAAGTVKVLSRGRIRSRAPGRDERQWPRRFWHGRIPLADSWCSLACQERMLAQAQPTQAGTWLLPLACSKGPSLFPQQYYSDTLQRLWGLQGQKTVVCQIIPSPTPTSLSYWIIDDKQQCLLFAV